MPISLRISSYQRLTPGQQERYTSDLDAVTLGRGIDNDFVLPDPQRFMSSVHCRIERREDDYVLTDLSTNGTFINGSEQRMARNASVVLSNNDQIRLGDYEFVVELSEDSDSTSRTSTDSEPGQEADEATSAGMTAFDLPAGGGAATKHDPDDDIDPFAEDIEPDPDQHTDDPGEREINTPVSHMDQNALNRGVDIDSILDLDDDDSDEADSGGSSGFESINEPMQAPKEELAKAPQDHVDFPDDWDETTSMRDVESSATDLPDDDGFPDEWDELADANEAGHSEPPAPAAPEQKELTEPQDLADEPEPRAETGTPAASPQDSRSSEPATAEPAPAKSSGQSTGTALPRGSADSALSAFASAAGIDLAKLNITDEAAFFSRLGKVNRAFTEGIMQALGGRASVKSEFRLDQTLIGPVENNPLKFSPRVEDAMVRILCQDEDVAYLHGTGAVREGFEDINAHQVAVMAGMEAALQGVLQRFSPDKLEKRLVSNSMLDNILPAAKKAKYWDIFKMMYSDIADEAQDDFQNLFGSEFSNAYDEQMSRLKKSTGD